MESGSSVRSSIRLDSPADLVDQFRKLFGALGGDSFDISLEDQKVLGLDQDVVFFQGLIVK
jgi:hypothetical protein